MGRWSHEDAANINKNAKRPRTRSIDLVFQKKERR
jgi:hypothetical protein